MLQIKSKCGRIFEVRGYDYETKRHVFIEINTQRYTTLHCKKTGAGFWTDAAGEEYKQTGTDLPPVTGRRSPVKWRD